MSNGSQKEVYFSSLKKRSHSPRPCSPLLSRWLVCKVISLCLKALARLSMAHARWWLWHCRILELIFQTEESRTGMEKWGILLENKFSGFFKGGWYKDVNTALHVQSHCGGLTLHKFRHVPPNKIILATCDRAHAMKYKKVQYKYLENKNIMGNSIFTILDSD